MQRAWQGVYLVHGSDPSGDFYYVGKGDLLRAHTSLAIRGGHRVEILASGLTEEAAYTVECATIKALQEAGVRILNKVNGHGAAKLTYAEALAASLSPQGGARTRLTLDDVGVAIELTLNLIHGHAGDDVRVSLFKYWGIARDGVRQIRHLLKGGTQIRVLGVAPSGIVAASFLLTSVKTEPHGGRRYLGLAADRDAIRFLGHYAPVRRQPGILYLTPAGAGWKYFKSLS